MISQAHYLSFRLGGALRRIPGLYIIKSPNVSTFRIKGSHWTLSGAKDLNAYEYSYGGWLRLILLTRLTERECVFSIDDRLQVFFDGYLTDVVDGTPPVFPMGSPAQAVAALYLKNGIYFLQSLRGSYSFLLIDQQREKAWLAVDRRASRPCFYQLMDGGAVFSPEVQVIAGLSPCSLEVDPVSVVDFCFRGNFFRDQTIFKNVYKLPPAGLVTLNPYSTQVSTYWEYQFTSSGEKSEEEYGETGHFLIRQSVQRLLKVVKKPFISLSGGIDSRLVYAYFSEQAENGADVVTYDSNTGDAEDAAIAREIVRSTGHDIIVKRVNFGNFVEAVQDVVEIIDGRIEIIDAFPLMSVWNDLAESYHTIVNGHQCFHVLQDVTSKEKALLFPDIQYLKLSQVQRFRSWVRPEFQKALEEVLSDRIYHMIKRYASYHPKDLYFVLYFYQRMSNYLNGFSAFKLRLFEQARPLLDEDLLDFGCRLPLSMRNEKKILHLILQCKWPQFARFPVAKVGFLPGPEDYRKLLSMDKGAFEFFKEEMTHNLDDSLANFIDARKVLETLERLVRRESLPALGVKWYRKLPGVWRLLPPRAENLVEPMFLLLRLFQTNLYLKRLKFESSIHPSNG
ncbi:MAG: asparagine synthase-related protein [Desulfosoma sp.]|uniref:asparagine synthase-related protein n=1 Tax=Desulfosoma sp. TaxID=2603217 RepID=UPI00404ADD21